MASDTVNHSDAILRVCSNSQRDLSVHLIRPFPREMQTVQESLQTAFETLPVSGMGTLDRLPPELILMIIRNLDIHSHFQLRQVNRRARILSTTSQEYRLVAKHGIDALQSLLSTGLAHHFTIADIYSVLINPRCMYCGCLGGFLFLLTATRCCFFCILSSSKLRLITTSTLARLSQISQSELELILNPIPGLRPVPGFYKLGEKQIRLPKNLFTEEQSIARLTSLGAVPKDFAYILVGHYDTLNDRLKASTVFPWYDPDTAQVEYGVGCKGCQDPFIALYIAFGGPGREFFSRTGFLTHFKTCAKAQKLWAEKKQGMKSV
ncbi:hypothetical protein F5Y00DRAFT_273802 [Daldinia vernicosa]|uniref:uncharacterized protein n=1 Tax=Daldinia vernicosa TaxID=114800 RepID=UPI002007BD0D|nr:uncharacterized protein F5Y00DRAFT_273802 [Daldinia vernicosa]KAI0852378.1 hypothetical protein F5Y00DRAFT_273802 [Daldinia vernicosa]